MKIDWEKRKEEIFKTAGCTYENDECYVGSLADDIISQEQSMLSKLEADKAELLEAVKSRLTAVLIKIDEAVAENFGYAPDYKWFDNLLTERDTLNQLIQKTNGGPTYE